MTGIHRHPFYTYIHISVCYFSFFFRVHEFYPTETRRFQKVLRGDKTERAGERWTGGRGSIFHRKIVNVTRDGCVHS